MSFSRCTILLKLSKISQRNAEFNCEIRQRFYSNKTIFSSASPQELNKKPKNYEEISRARGRRKEERNCEGWIRRDRKTIFKLQEVSKCASHEETQSFNNVDRKTQKDKLPVVEEITNFKNHHLFNNAEESEIVQLQTFNDFSDVDNSIPSPVKSELLDSDLNCEKKEFTRYKLMETSEGMVKYNLSGDEFNLDKFVNDFNASIPGPLDVCDEDVSDFGPSFPPTFNFAAYADKSNLIQEYVKLGVKLYKIEKNHDHMRALLSVDLEKELPMCIQFLHDCGVPADNLGDVITDSPMVLKEDMDDMKTRIRYLRAHNFSKESIARIVTKNPSWLLWATKKIDERLGHFQNEFQLYGPEVRFLATKQPKLITYNYKHIQENTFAIREEMGFNKQEMKLLLLDKPRLWMNSRKKIVDTFEYLLNTMKLSHRTIASQSDILTTRKSRLKSRHEFLVELKKVQYDPTKPGYISPQQIAVGSDEDFCKNVAKASIETYNLFLKTR